MMSSKRGGGQSNRASKGKNIIGGSSHDVDQLNQAVQDVNLDPNQDGNWEVISKKNKNKTGNGASSKQWAAQTPKPNAWGQPDAQRTGGRGTGQVRAPNNRWATQSGRGGGGGPINYNYNPPSNAIAPPLQSGWNWNARPANAWQLGNDAGRRENIPEVVQEDQNQTVDFNGSDDDDDDDDDDDELLTDEYDSDETPKLHESRKKNKWYSEFFSTLDSLTVDQMNEPTRQWHCPACQNGPGAIDWYSSLASLVTHAKTKGSKRVKIHRDLAEILEEELRRRGATVLAAGESFGQWKGMNEVDKDKEIVWPPMVVIMNTLLEQDENDKWIGMGNEELLDYFGSYEAVKGRHSYGPKGHRGMSVLIFQSSAVGYTEAERLSKDLEKQGMGRYAWDHSPNLFQHGGKRQLYGYLATKRDLDVFNQHSHGKTKLKFELVSYQENVVNQLKQMNEDNQQLNWYKNQILKDKMNLKSLEESRDLLSQKLRKNEEEIRIVRERTRKYHEQNKEELDSQEQFIKDTLKVIPDAKEDHFDKSFSVVDLQKRDERLEEMKEFKEEREKLVKRHEEETAELKNRYWKEQNELDEGFKAKLTQLMDKYTIKDQV